MSELGILKLNIPQNSISNVKENQTPKFGSLTIDTPDVAFRQGQSLASVRNFDVRPYEDFLGKGNVNMNLPIDILNELRAQNQSGWGLAGKAIGQTATTIVGGILSGIGAVMGGIEMLTTNLLKEKPESWENVLNEGVSGFFNKTGIGIEDFGRESMPIYQTKRAQEGAAFGDSTWWASMFPTVGSAVASFVPVLGWMKTVGYVGKLAKLANSATKLGRLANKTGRLLTNPTTQKLMGTIMGAHLDSMIEIAHGYDDQFQYALNLGFSEEDSRKFAATYASEAYKDSWALNLMTNAIQMNTLFKGVTNAPINSAKISKQLDDAVKGFTKQGSKYIAPEQAVDLTKKAKGKLFAKSGYDWLKTSVAEGFEEMRMDYALTEGEIAAKDELGIYDYRSSLTPLARLGLMVKDANAWDSFIWGAIGGGVMQGIMGGENGPSLVQRVLNGKKIREWEQQRSNKIINTLQDVTKSIETLDGDMMPEIVESNDGKRITIKDNAVKTLAPIFDSLSKSNGFEYANQLFEGISQLSNKEIALAYGSTEGVSDLNTLSDDVLDKIGAKKRASIEALRSEFKIAQDIYRKNSQNLWGSKYDSWINDMKSKNEYLANYYKRWENAIKTEIAVKDPEFIAAERVRNEALSEINKKRFELEERINTINTELAALKDIEHEYDQSINDEKTIKDLRSLNGRKGNYAKAIKKVESEIESIRLDIQNLNNNIEFEANESRKKKNRKDRDVNKLAIKQLKKQRTDLNNRLLEKEKQLNQLTLELDDLNTNIEIRKGQINVYKANKELVTSAIDNYTKELEIINRKLTEEKTKENNTNEEYANKKQQLLVTPNDNNRTISDLNYLLKEVHRAKLLYEKELTQKEIKEVLIPEIDKLVDMQEEFKKHKEEAQEKEEKVEQEIAEIESKEITPDTETDVAGVEFARNEKGAISWVKINGLNIRKGDKLNFNGKPEIVQRIEIRNDDGGNLIYIKTPNTEHTASRLQDNKVTKYEEKIVDDLNTKVGRIKARLRTLIPSDKIELSPEASSTKQTVFEDILDGFAKDLEEYIDIENNQIVIPIQHLNRITSILQNIIEINPYDSSVELYENMNEDITTFKNGVSKIINQSRNHEVNRLIDVTFESADKHLKEFEKILESKKDSPYLETYKKLYDFYKHLHHILSTRNIHPDLYDEMVYNIDVDAEEYTNIFNEYNEISKYLTEDIYTVKDIDFDLVKDLNESGISADITPNIQYMMSILYAEFNQNIVYRPIEDLSIEDTLFNVSLFDDEDFADASVDKSDYTYHISEANYQALRYVVKLLDQFDLRDQFDSKKKYNFNDIIDAIYQMKDGVKLVRENTLTIFNLLKYVHKGGLSSDIYQMKHSGVDEDIIKELELVNEKILSKTHNPLNVDLKYLNGELLNIDKYLDYFFRTYHQREWDINRQNGIRRLNAYVYQKLREVYNSIDRTIEDIITIDGVTVNTKDLYEALESIRSGQIFETEYDAKSKSLIIKLQVGDQTITLERFSLGEHENYEGFSLTDGDGNYNSVFGNKDGISIYVEYILNSIKGRSGLKVFNDFREFYKIYEENRIADTHNDPKVQKELRNILKHLKETNPDLFNNFIVASKFGLSTEEIKQLSIDENNIDLRAIYTLIKPLFYNKRLETLDDMRRDNSRSRISYQTFNNALYQDFTAAKSAIEEGEKSGMLYLRLNHINKTGIAYGGNKSRKYNINENIKKDANGKVTLITTQPHPDSKLPIVSNINTKEIIPINTLPESFKDPNNHVQMFARVKANASETGYSYIPLVRGNVNTNGNEFSKILTPFIADKILEIFSTADLTFHGSKEVANVYVPSAERKSEMNNKWDAIQEDLKPYIIVSQNQGDINYLSLGSLYKKTNTDYSKKLKFIQVDRTPRNGRLGTSWEVTLEVFYEKTDEGFKPKSIVASRVRTKANYVPSGLPQPLFTQSQLKDDIGKHVKEYKYPKDGDKVKRQRIDLTDDITLEKVLTSDIFQDVFGKMQRAVNTYFYGKEKANGGFVFGSHDAEHRGKFSVKHLKDLAKKKGIKFDNSQIPDEYNSIQDFYLDTFALTTSAVGIRNKSGEVISNYMVDGVSPAMWFEVYNPNEALTQSQKDNKPVKDDRISTNEYLDKITKIQGNKSWWTAITENVSPKEVLNNIGINTSNMTEGAINDIVNLFNDLYNRVTISLNITTTKQNNGRDTYGSYTHKNKELKLNSKYTNNPDFNEVIGLTILHETIHAYVLNTKNNKGVTYNKLISDSIYPDIENIYKGIDDISLEDFNKKYQSNFDQTEFDNFKKYITHVYNNSSEIVTYMFTDPIFAGLANRVIIGNVENTDQPETLWSKFIKAVLKLIGINNIKDNSLLQAIVAGSVRPTYSPTGSVSNEQLQTPVKKTIINKPIDDKIDVDEDSLFNEDVIEITSRTAGRGVGYAHTSREISNENVLKSKELLLPLNSKDFLKIDTNFKDANNQPIC